MIEHEAMCPPGWVGDWLVAAGVELDVRRPYSGDPLPDDLTAHDGMLVLGGSMNAYDDATHPWLTAVKQLVRVAEDVPTLGICLGHQLVAVALGGEVVRSPLGQQMGIVPVGWTAEAGTDDLFGAVAGSQAAVMWNSDTVNRLPEGAVALARTVGGELQAARFGPRLWGLQWHPEVDDRIVKTWAEHDRDDARKRGVDVDDHLAALAAAREQLHAAWEPLGRQFAALVRKSAASRVAVRAR